MTTLVRDTDTLTRDALAVLQPGFVGADRAPDWLLRQLDAGLAGVGLFGRNITSPEQLAQLTARLRAVRPEVLVAIDEEGGDVTRLEAISGSSFPGNHALGHVDDTGLTRDVAAELGRRLAACGATVNWAPCADVNSNPDNPVIGVRSFGADQELVARHTVAYVEGLQAAGVAACVKHFPGHGDTNVDSHLALPRIDTDLTTFQQRELVPFRAAVEAGARCVMSAHILLPALDPDHPGTLSRAALTGLLRAPADEGGLGFTGLIYTDAMEMEAISATYGLERGSVLAVAAGADAVCIGGYLADEGIVLRLRDALIGAVRGGHLSEERLHDAAERVRALGRWTVAARNERSPGGATAAAAAGVGAVGVTSATREDARGEAYETGTAVAAEPDIGLTAARRALQITEPAGTDAPWPLTRAPYVAAFTPMANNAVGAQTPWGIAPELTRLLPGTRTGNHTREQAEREGTAGLIAGVLAAAADRPIVAVVRDVHRHPWMAVALDALLAARPGTMVVEMGIPRVLPAGAPHIATHGAARVCGQAAAEAITGRGPS